MDNLPKEDQTSPDQQGGEIFSSASNEFGNQSVDSRPEIPSETIADQYQPVESINGGTEARENSNQDQINSEMLSPSDNSTMTSPPAYIEDSRKKYLIIAVLIVLVLSVVGYLAKSILVKKTPSVAQPVTLTYWGLWEDKEVLQPVIDEYKRSKPNITINYIKQDPKQYRERLQEAIKRGEGPDIFRYHNSWLPMMQSYLSPVPKSIYSDTDFENTFYPVVSDDLKSNNNFFGIPLEIDGLLLFYNEDILKGANIDVPVTWEDVQNAVAKITVKQSNRIVTSGIALGTAENIEHFSDILGLMMLQGGVELSQSFFKCTDPKITTCAVEVLSYYRKFSETPNNTWDETLDNSILAFSQGKVAMIFAPSWQIYTIKTLNPNLNFKTASVPQLPCKQKPCASINWASYWVEGVSSKSRNSNSAWEFLKFLSQSEILQKIYSEQVKYRKLFGEPYSRRDLGKALSDNPYLAPLIASAPTMKSFFLASKTYDGDTGLNSKLIDYLKNAVNSLAQGVSPETALKTAEEGFKTIYSRFDIITPVPTQ